MGGHPVSAEGQAADIDLVAVEQGYVSITPLQFDLTCREELTRLESFFA
jgi:broad specificity polyphosphatase/5'/3'-nucleotidase SurE